jgi:hypothetical protein
MAREMPPIVHKKDEFSRSSGEMEKKYITSDFQKIRQ